MRSRTFVLWLVSFFAVLPIADAAAQNPFLQNRGPRTVESITFVGNEITREYVLARALGFEAGDPYDAELVGEAWERLEQLPYIAYVEIDTVRPGPGKVALEILVEEDTRFRWAPGLDYSRRQGDSFSGSVLVGYDNLTGRGESMEVQASAWAHRGVRGRWQNPWILGGARLGVYAEADWRRHDWEYETEFPKPDSDFTDWGAALGLWRAFDRVVTLNTEFRWREVQFANGGVVQDPIVDLVATQDWRDSPFYPTDGHVVRGDLRFGGFGDDIPNQYVIGTVSVSGFRTLPRVDTVLAAHASLRGSSDPLPFYEKTYLGGPLDLRGLDFGSVPGDEAWRLAVELRRPILLLPLREGRTIGLGAHAFHERGAAWAADLSPDSAEARFSSGLGLHFNFNTSSFRFEWAHTDEGENVFVFEDRFTF